MLAIYQLHSSQPQKQTQQNDWKLIEASRNSEDTTSLLAARKPDLILIKREKRTCQLMDFTIPTDHRVKIKESKKIGAIPKPCQRAEKIWNMKMIVIQVTVEALGTIKKT